MIKGLQLGKLGSFQLFHLMRQLTGILIAIFLAKSTLAIGIISTYEKLIYIGFALSFFWVAGLIQGMLALYPEKEESGKRIFIFNAYLLFLGLSVLVYLLSLAFESTISQVFTSNASIPYFGWFILYMCLNWPTYLLENFFLLQDKPNRILQFGGFAFGGYLIAISLPVILAWNLKWIFINLVVLAGLKHVWLLLYLFREGQLVLDGKMIQQWVRVSIPLILYALMGGLNQVFDNWLVNFIFSEDEQAFALFRYGAKELPLTIALANAFSVGLIPEVAQNLDNALMQIKEKSLRLFHLLFPISMILMLTSHWIFPIVFEPEFYESSMVFNVFLLLIINRLVFPHTVIIGLKDNHVMTIVSVIELIFNVIASFILVQFFGLWGIALGSIVGYSVEKVLDSLYLYFKYGIRFSQYTPVAWFVGYSIALVACFLASLLIRYG